MKRTITIGVEASYIKDWLKRYFQDFDQNQQKFVFPIDPQDQVIAEELRQWLDRFIADERPGGFNLEGEEKFPRPTPEILNNPRNRLCLYPPVRWDSDPITVTVDFTVWVREETPQCAAGESLENELQFRIIPLRPRRTKLDIEWAYPSVSGFVDKLVDTLIQDYPEAKPTRKAKETKGPNDTTQERAKLYKGIKDKHPECSYAQVALKANGVQPDRTHTEDTVRNAYRAMGWKWGEKAGSIS